MLVLSLNALLAQDSGAWQVLVEALLVAAAGGFLIIYLIRHARRSRPPNRPSPPRTDPSGLLDELADAIIGVDGEDRIVHANRRAKALFGYAPKELYGRNYQSLLILPGGFAEADAHQIIGGGQVIGLEHNAYGLHKDGSRFAGRVTVTNSKTGPMRGLVAVRKVDEHSAPAPGKLEPPPEQLLQAAERIRHFAKLISYSKQLQSVDQDLLLALKKSTEDLYAHLNLSSHATSIQTGQLSMNPQPLLIGPWLAQKLNSYKAMLANHRANFNLPPLEKSSLIVLTDEGILGEILEALLNFILISYQSPNLAVHMMNDNVPQGSSLPSPSKTGEKEVGRVGSNRKFGLLLIAGTPTTGENEEEDEDSLVDRIASDPHIRLAKQLVSLINGELSVDANAYSGLLFHFSITCRSFGEQKAPALTERESEIRQEVQPIPNPDAEHPGTETPDLMQPKERTVLSITKDANLKNWVREILEAEGFHVQECLPEHAVEKIRDGEAIDLVVLQPALSQEPDFDLTYEMRQFRKPEELPILLVRKRESTEARISYFSAQDAVDFPDNGHELAEKVVALYEQKTSFISPDKTG